jgi:predicted phosphodiesterase
MSMFSCIQRSLTSTFRQRLLKKRHNEKDQDIVSPIKTGHLTEKFTIIRFLRTNYTLCIIYVGCICIFGLVCLAIWFSILILTSFKCGWRKQPLIAYWNATHISVTGETNCQLPGTVRLQWQIQRSNTTTTWMESPMMMEVAPIIYADRRYVYQAIFAIEDPTKYVKNYTCPTSTIKLRWNWGHTDSATYSSVNILEDDLKHTDTSKDATRFSLPVMSFRHIPDIACDQCIQPCPSQVNVALIADSQYNAPIFRQLLASIAMHQPDVWIHAGDAVQNAMSLKSWEREFFNPIAEAKMNQVPLIYARGNHDDILNELRPEEAITNTEGVYHQPNPSWYALTIGGARWIVLDALRDDNPEQNRFLQQELEQFDPTIHSFLIVVLHVPPYIEFWDPEGWANHEGDKWGPNVRRRWAPWFEAYHVDLVIAGHQHNYQRGQHQGTTYTIIGGGGGALDEERVEDWHMYHRTAILHHYALINLTEQALHWTAYSLDGDVIDSFKLDRRKA